MTIALDRLFPPRKHLHIAGINDVRRVLPFPRTYRRARQRTLRALAIGGGLLVAFVILAHVSTRSIASGWSVTSTVQESATLSASGYRASPSQESRHIRNCAEARSLGLAPIYRGQPGYAAHLDRDNDGIACEPYRGR
jgi:Excalibur calcium-binding domain